MRLRILLAAMLSALGLIVIAAPAQAGTSIINGSGGVYHCTSTAAPCTSAFTSFGKGAGLSMVCWRDDRWATGTYRSNRWFFVRFDTGTEGYVHSSKVARQTSTPNCSKVPRVQATQWAINRLGQTAYVNLCLKFVHDAWLSVGKNIGTASTAAAYWRAHGGHQSGTRPPRGALVFWDGRAGYPEGHVAISLGGGYAVSTYERSTTTVHILSIADRNRTHGASYLGWLMP